MPRLFISVSSSDRAYANALKSLLGSQSSENGPAWDCYFYEHSAEQGPIPENIAKQIENRDTFLAIVTPEYFNSGWCVNERNYARFLGKPTFHFRPTEAHSIVPDLDAKLQPPLFEAVSSAMTRAFGEIDIPLAAGGTQRLKLAQLAFKHLNDRSRDPLEMLASWLHLPDEVKVPFPGMTSFSQDMGGILFGRDDEISEALKKFKDFHNAHGSGVFLIKGASGSGKSSFMRAGLLSRLSEATDRYFVAPTFKPQQAPNDDTVYEDKSPNKYFLKAVQELFEKLKFGALESRHVKTEGLPGLLRDEVEKQAKRIGVSEGRPIIFSIDQGEELFIGEGKHSEQKEIGEFLAAIETMVNAQKGVIFLMTIRSDDQAARIERMRVKHDEYRLPQMQLVQLRHVINGPLTRPEFSNVQFSESAVNILMEQTARIRNRDTALPLLSLALRELWEAENRPPPTRTVIDLPENFRLDQHLAEKLEKATDELGRLLKLKPDELNSKLKKFFSNFIVPDHDGSVRFKVVNKRFQGDEDTIAETFVKFRLLLGDPSPTTASYERPFDKGFPSAANADSRSSCGREKRAPGWRRSTAAPSGIPLI